MASNIATHVDPIHGVTIATLPAITSLAASLGAARPSAGVVKSALDRAGFVTNVSAPDELAMKAALEFAGQWPSIFTALHFNWILEHNR